MPAAVSQQIDWSGIRANAVTMGIRAAARAAAVNLPPDEANRLVKRALKRAEREGWVKAKEKAMSSVVVVNEKTLSSNVVNGADSMAIELAENSKQSRTSLGKAVVKAAKTFEDMPGPEIIEKGQQLRNVAASGSQVFGWEDRKAADAGLVSVTMVRLELPANHPIEPEKRVFDV
jgi:hypothetical protein